MKKTKQAQNKSRSVKQLNKNGELIKIWSRKELLSLYKLNQLSFIYQVCSGREKSAYGYKWELMSDGFVVGLGFINKNR